MPTVRADKIGEPSWRCSKLEPATGVPLGCDLIAEISGGDTLERLGAARKQ